MGTPVHGRSAENVRKTANNPRHTTISAKSTTARVVTQRRARQQPYPRTAPEPWNLCVFCTACTVGTRLRSEDELNLRHLQLEPRRLLELVADGHRDVERRESRRSSAQFAAVPLHNLKLRKGDNNQLQDLKHPPAPPPHRLSTLLPKNPLWSYWAPP